MAGGGNGRADDGGGCEEVIKRADRGEGASRADDGGCEKAIKRADGGEGVEKVEGRMMRDGQGRRYS
jgi:hypothetical protein